MEKTNPTRIAMFTLFLLGAIGMAAQGILTNAFAAHQGEYFYHDGLKENWLIENNSNSIGDVNEVMKDLRINLQQLKTMIDSGEVTVEPTFVDLDACPYPTCL